MVKYGKPYCRMVVTWGKAPGRCGQPDTVCSPRHDVTNNSRHEVVKSCEVMVYHVVTSLS